LKREPIYQHREGYILVVAAAACWATLGPLGRAAFAEGILPQTLVTLRTAIAAFLLFIVLCIFQRRALNLPKRALPLFTGLGIAVAINYGTFFQSLGHLQIGVAISLFYVYPVFVVIGAFFLFREPFSFSKLLALITTVAGCSFVAGLWEHATIVSAAGIALSFASAAGCAAYMLLVKHAIRSHPPSQILLYSLTFALPFLFLSTILVDEVPSATYSARGWSSIALLALIPTLLGYYLFTRALRQIESSRASIVSTLEPALASLIAFAAFGERLSLLQILGMGLILSGAILVRTRRG
jgi:drug/metabolite transporter (DMT)-like permease